MFVTNKLLSDYFVLFQRLRIYADNPLTIGDMGIGHEDSKQFENPGTLPRPIAELIKEMATEIGVSNSAINKHIIRLRKESILKREGADKGGKWVIIK